MECEFGYSNAVYPMEVSIDGRMLEGNAGMKRPQDEWMEHNMRIR